MVGKRGVNVGISPHYVSDRITTDFLVKNGIYFSIITDVNFL